MNAALIAGLVVAVVVLVTLVRTVRASRMTLAQASASPARG